MNKLILPILILFFSIFQTNLFSQCNSVSSLNIDNIALVSGDGITCTYEATISLIVSTAGNASACLVYQLNGLETKTCWNGGTALVSQPVTFDADCGEIITLSGYSSPNGTGSACSGAIPFSPPLPVELISFKAKRQNNQVVIEWITATEENNDYFEVQHSTNGRDFISIAAIKGQGNNSVLQQYHYMHTNPSKGYNYYRLKQVDYDGKSEIFGTAVVKFKDNLQSYLLYPSEAHDMITIETPELKSNNTVISIYNSNGSLLHQEILAGETNKVSVNVSNLPAGIYFLRMFSEGVDYIAKQFIKTGN